MVIFSPGRGEAVNLDTFDAEQSGGDLGICDSPMLLGTAHAKRHAAKEMRSPLVLRKEESKLRSVCMTARCRIADGKRHRNVMQKSAQKPFRPNSQPFRPNSVPPNKSVPMNVLSAVFLSGLGPLGKVSEVLLCAV